MQIMFSIQKFMTADFPKNFHRAKPNFSAGSTESKVHTDSFSFATKEHLSFGLLAILIYLPGIFWGLPHATHPLGVHGWDLDAVTGLLTLSEIHNLLVEPKEDWYLAYPLFHYLLIALAYVPYMAILYLSGGVSNISPEYPFGLTDPVGTLKHLALIGRLITLLMAGGLIVNVYLTAQTLWNRKTARIAAFAAALPVPVVYYARTGNLDLPVLFWMSLTVLLMARCVVAGFTMRRAMWLGFAAALAVATKDQAYGALIIGLLGVVIHSFRQRENQALRTDFWKSFLVLIVSGATFFGLASGVFFSPTRFFGHIWFITNYDKTFFNVIYLDILRPKTLTGYFVLTFDVINELFISIGPIFLGLALIGLVRDWRTNAFAKILIAMTVGYVVLVIFPIRHMQFRYILFPTIVAAFFVARGALTLIESSKNRWLKIVSLIIISAGFLWVGLRAVDLTWQKIFDARYAAGDWFEQNTNPGDAVIFFTSQNILPHLKKETKAIRLLNDPAPLEKIRQEKARFIIVQPDFSSEFESDKSYFFPPDIYEQLNSGELGYERVAAFKTKGLFKGFYLDLPLVSPGYITNPSIKIYELTDSSVLTKNETTGSR